MMFLGGLAFALCLLLLGFLWPHKTPHSIGVSLWGYFVKSLFIAWFIFLISFHTNLRGAIGVGSVFLVAYSVMGILSCKVIFYRPSLENARFGKEINLLFAVVLLALAIPFMAQAGRIFGAWDAVASWNRWAIELASNQYDPQAAAYPILWPSIWSLIYEAQRNANVWYFSTATLMAPPVFLIILCADQIRNSGVMSGFVLSALIYLLLLSNPSAAMNGYMDVPVAVMGMGSLVLLYLAINEEAEKKRFELFLFAALSAGLATITKQSGLPFLVFVLIFIANEFRNKAINARGLASLFVLALAPLATFLAIYLNKRDSVIGNLSTLRNRVDQSRGEQSALTHAVDLFVNETSAIAAVFLLLGITLSAVLFKNIHRFFSYYR